jgi:hypothetical protein
MKAGILAAVVLAMFGINAHGEAKLYMGIGVFNEEFVEIVPRLANQEIVRRGSFGEFYFHEANAFMEISMSHYIREPARGKTAIAGALNKSRDNFEKLPPDIQFGKVILIIVTDGMETVVGKQRRSEVLQETSRRLSLPLANGVSPECLVFLFDGDEPAAELEKKEALRNLAFIAGEHVFLHRDLYDAESKARNYFDNILSDSILKDEGLAIYWLLDRSQSTRTKGSQQAVGDFMRYSGKVIAEAVDRLVDARKPVVDEDTIFVKGGEFLIGSSEVPNALPPGRIVLKGFHLAKTELTRWQYYHIAQKHIPGLPEPNSASKDLPVTGISFHEAARWCNWLSEYLNRPLFYDIYYDEGGGIVGVTEKPWVTGAVRLPSQEEIEYVQSLSWPPAPGALNLDSGQAVDVKSLTPDFQGFYGLFGNVLEITGSTLKEDTSRNMIILKGGSFSDEEVFPPSYRWWEPPDYSDSDLGFRYCIDFIQEG